MWWPHVVHCRKQEPLVRNFMLPLGLFGSLRTSRWRVCHAPLASNSNGDEHLLPSLDPHGCFLLLVGGHCSMHQCTSLGPIIGQTVADSQEPRLGAHFQMLLINMGPAPPHRLDVFPTWLPNGAPPNTTIPSACCKCFFSGNRSNVLEPLEVDPKLSARRGNLGCCCQKQSC